MALNKTHKRKKYSRYHGRGMGTAGTGSRKNKRKSGHKGGCGMAGTGKRADHKKTLINNLYGNDYFGKQGVTSRGTKKDKRQRINIGEIQENIQKFGKKIKEGYEVNLPKYKILGKGEVKDRLIINALAVSESALKKIKKAGGEVKIKENKEASKNKDSKSL
jgi:large subunit ribosomal protein L15